MTVVLDDGDVVVHHGDCLEVLAALPDGSVDAIVTDPPYALPGGFMGKAWDAMDGREDIGFAYYLSGLIDGEGTFRVGPNERRCEFAIKLRDDDRQILEAARRFMGHGRINTEPAREGSLPQARWVIDTKDGCLALVGFLRRFPLRAKKARDAEVWCEAVGEWTGQPRGNRWHGPADRTRLHALGERIKDVREYREVPWSGHRFQDWTREWAEQALRVLKPGGHLAAFGGTRTYHRLTAGLEDAGFEIRDCLSWLYGSGFPKSLDVSKAIDRAAAWDGWGTALKPAWEPIVLARKPLAGTVAGNVLEHGTGALNIDGCRVAASGRPLRENAGRESVNCYGDGLAGSRAAGTTDVGRWPANVVLDDHAAAMLDEQADGPAPFYGDAGGPSRFFYTAKASRSDRGATNTHPTVKPTDLMRWVIRLVTPPGGVVLDPFAGSGTTGVAARAEGVRCVLIEREEEYVRIIRGRLAQLSLFGEAA